MPTWAISTRRPVKGTSEATRSTSKSVLSRTNSSTAAHCPHVHCALVRYPRVGDSNYIYISIYKLTSTRVPHYYDPLVKSSQNINKNVIKYKKQVYDIIILAVPHKDMFKFIKNNLKNILKDGGYFIDLNNNYKLPNKTTYKHINFILYVKIKCFIHDQSLLFKNDFFSDKMRFLSLYTSHRRDLRIQQCTVIGRRGYYTDHFSSKLEWKRDWNEIIVELSRREVSSKEKFASVVVYFNGKNGGDLHRKRYQEYTKLQHRCSKMYIGSTGMKDWLLYAWVANLMIISSTLNEEDVVGKYCKYHITLK